MAECQTPLDKGLLILIDGIDGSGKTTQCHLLHEAFRFLGLKSTIVKEPSADSPYVEKIHSLRSQPRGQVSKEKELKWFTEDTRHNVENHIRPKLREGFIVIMDRYYHSTIAYQGGLGLDPECIKAKNEAFAPAPDITIILDIPVTIAIERINSQRQGNFDSFEEEGYLKKVRDVFLQMQSYGNVRIVEGGGSIPQVFGRVLSAVRPVIADKYGMLIR